MFRKIKNIVNGNNWDWNVKHNEEAKNLIIKDFSKLNDDEKKIAEIILESSSILLAVFLGPNRKNLTFEKISDDQIKKINWDQHYSMLVYCFEMFVRMFETSKNYKHLPQIYHKIIGEYFITIEPKNNQSKRLKSLIKLYSNEIAITSKVINPNDPVFFYSFFNTAVKCATLLKKDLIIKL